MHTYFKSLGLAQVLKRGRIDFAHYPKNSLSFQECEENLIAEYEKSCNAKTPEKMVEMIMSYRK